MRIEPAEWTSTSRLRVFVCQIGGNQVPYKTELYPLAPRFRFQQPGIDNKPLKNARIPIGKTDLLA